MKFRTRLAFIVLLNFILTLFFTFPGSAKDSTVSTENGALKQDLLDGIFKRYSQKSFSAEFSQVSILKALEMTEIASGRAWFSHPGKMKWRYLHPEEHDIITNGQTLWIYRPLQRQVMLGEASEFFQSGAGGAFLSDINLMRDNFHITVENKTASWVELRLVPLKKTEDITAIVIRVFRMTYMIQQITTVNSFGDTTKIDFSNIKFGPMPEGWFDFTVPDGVNILNMSEQ